MMFGTLTRKTGAVAAARLAGAFASMATSIMLGWVLGKTENGLVQKAFIVTQMATLIGSFGIQTSLYFFLPRIKPGQKRLLILQSVFFLFIIATFIAAAIFFGAGAIAKVMHEPALVPYLHAGALAVLASLPMMIADPLFIAEDHAWLATSNSIAGAVLQVGLVAYGLITGKPPQFVFTAIAVSAAFRVLPALVFAAAKLPPGKILVPQIPLLVQQAAYILPVGLAGLVDTLSNWMDRSLVSIFYDAAHQATYTYGAIELPFISIVIGAATPVLMSEFSRYLKDDKTEEVLELWHRSARKTAIILFGLFFFFMWMAPEFLGTVYSQKYRDSAPYLRIYLLLLPIRIVAYMPMLFALGRRSYVAVGSVIEVLLNLAISLILMRQTNLGMAGAALGTVISTLWQVWFFMGGIRRGLKTTWQFLLPWSALARDFFYAGLFFLPLGILKLRYLPDQLDVIAASAFFGIYAWYRILPRLSRE